MNLFLRIFNLLGVFILSVLLVIQWQVNSRVNQRANSLETIRQQQQAKLEENDRTIKGYIADLDEFRQRLTLAESQLKDLESKLNQMTTERNQLAAERDQLKSAMSKWMAAVTERDAAIKQAGTEIQKLAAERNDVVKKLNDLAGKYNKLVEDWNGQQKK
jgi:chromosome segregation ATPase